MWHRYLIRFYSFAIVAIISMAAVITTRVMARRCKSRVFDAFAKYGADAKKVLDLGCGSCCNGRKIMAAFPGKNVTAIDIVDKGTCESPMLFDGKTIPFPDNSFDIGLCSFVLHHARSYRMLIDELRRTCRRIIVIENTPESDSEWAYVKKHSGSDWGTCMECFKTAADWRNTFRTAGLTVVAEERISKWRCPFSDHPFYYPVTCTVFVLERQ